MNPSDVFSMIITVYVLLHFWASLLFLEYAVYTDRRFSEWELYGSWTLDKPGIVGLLPFLGILGWIVIAIWIVFMKKDEWRNH